MKKLAAIDIGTNGARLLIKSFEPTPDGEVRIKRIMYMRVPLRLGMDVFTSGKISKLRQSMMKDMLKAYKFIMHLNGVDQYRACATAAMRDAKNGPKVMRMIKKRVGIRLEIISGKEEAMLLCNNILENPAYQKGNYAFIDVGGGSAEVSLITDGQLVSSRSYNIGTLRILNDKMEKDDWNQMRLELTEHAKDMKEIHIIGSGGNINKLFKLANTKKEVRKITIEQLQAIYDKLCPLSVEERMTQFELKPDRADVIIPAAEIFLMAAKALNTKNIEVPNISLADSIVDGLYKDLKEKQ